MTITEAVALGRARATKAAFPRGKISVAQARAMVVAMAESQVGYASGNPSYSMYGKAYTWPEGMQSWDGRQVYWCVLGGGSWVPAWAFGYEAALAGFGRQVNSRAFPPVGGTWTVWVLDLARATGRVKAFNDVQAGDIVLTNWGRTGAEVDHYDVATGPRSLNIIPVIGFNTSSGNASAGAGVFRAWRPRNRVVAVIEPDYEALVRVYNATIPEENEMSSKEYRELKAVTDDILNVVNHHLRGDISKADMKAIGTGREDLGVSKVVHLTAGRVNSIQAEVAEALALLREVREKQNDLRDGINVVGRVAAEGRDQALTEEALTRAIFTHMIQGFSFEWWVRNGMVLDKDHRQYPADPGSLADLVMRMAAKMGIEFEVYDGTQRRPIGPDNLHRDQAALDLGVEVDR